MPTFDDNELGSSIRTKLNNALTKVDGIEDGATDDQTGAEIKALYELEPSAFTDAQFTKLAGIEAGATADQTGAEIKALYEAEADTNAFTDADHSKLDGIEAGATADQTDAEIKTAYENNADTNAFTDAEQTTLSKYGNYDTRADFVSAVGSLSVPDGGIVFADGLQYKASSGSTDISDLPGFVPAGDAYPDHFGENTTPGTTDMGAAINAAIDYVDSLSGGIVRFRAQTYLTSVTITPTRNVTMEGEGAYWLNDYKNNQLVTRGSWIKLANASNVDVILIRADVSQLFENSFPRVHVKISGLGINGNRSESYLAGVGNTDLNSSGNCIKCEGVSYVTLEDVSMLRAAERGLYTTSYDYGDGNGARGTNNFHFTRVRAIQCELSGIETYAGDSTYSDIVGGANGDDGIRAGSGSWSNVLTWNNKRDGFRVSGEVRVYGIKSYDNDFAGYHAISGGNHVLTGGEISNNGKAVSGDANQQVGVNIDSSVTEIIIDGLQVFDDDSGNQLRGIRSNGSGPKITLGAIDSWGHPTSDVSISDYTTAHLHGPDLGSTVIRHPGFTLTGNIDADDNQIRNVEALTFDAWTTVSSLSSGTYAAGATSLSVANISGGGTVTDITGVTSGLPILIIRNSNASALTFQNSSSKLRLIGGANVTLNQHEAIIFVWVSGTVWQQVGGK